MGYFSLMDHWKSSEKRELGIDHHPLHHQRSIVKGNLNEVGSGWQAKEMEG
jgi:hypothetical protein